MSWEKFLSENPQITIAEIVDRCDGAPLALVSTDDLEKDIDRLYTHGRDPGFSTGWSSMDVHYRIAPRYWTLVSGWPNMGKSSWVDNLAVNTMRRHHWRWLFFSAENQPYEAHWAGLAELYCGYPFNIGASQRMTPLMLEQAKTFLSAHCWHITPDDNMTVKRIIKVAQDAIDKWGINCVVIDPWNELDHSRPVNMNETEYVSNALSQIRRFARENEIHVFVVAHPAKMARLKDGALPVPTPHDVSGSSHFWNKSDYAICVWRDFGDVTGETHIYVQKARHRWISRLGRVALFYEPVTGRFIDPHHRPTIDELMQGREPGSDDE